MAPAWESSTALADWTRRATRMARRHAGRALALVAPPQSPLAPEQEEAYARDGFLLAREAIPREVAERAAVATWEGAGADPFDRSTWPALGPQPRWLDDWRVVAAFTDDVLSAAGALAGEGARFSRPQRTLAINRVPLEREWRAHGAHVDFSLPEEGPRTRPLPYRIGAIAYLTDVAPHGGGTIVWPGTHRRLEGLVRAEPGRYALMSALNADLRRLDLGPGVELTPSRGDVLFFHPLCVHASSDNVTPAPRLALNQKW